jgi:hypothetical protein
MARGERGKPARRTGTLVRAATGIESAAAAIDFAGPIDEAVRNKNGREELDAASAQLNGIREYQAVAT